MTAAWINPPTGQIWPLQPRDLPLGPRCDATVRAPGKQRDFRERHYSEPLRCRRPASCTIDGRNYCSAHGGEIALHRICGTEPTAVTT